MEMRLRAPVTRGYFFLLGALRLVNAASPRNIDQKKNILWNPGYGYMRCKRNVVDVEVEETTAALV